MENVWSFVIVALSFYIFLFIHDNFGNGNKKRNGFPNKRIPGPISLPLFGSIPHIVKVLRFADLKLTPLEMLTRISLLWGSCVKFIFGPYEVIVISDINVAKKLLSSEDWSERLHEHHFIHERSFGKSLGILASHGEIWKETRRFLLRTMSRLGFNRSNMLEVMMEEEMQHFFPYFDSKIASGFTSVPLNNNGKVSGIVNMDKIFCASAYNILWKMLGTLRFEYEGHDFTRQRDFMEVISSNIRTKEALLLVFPWLRNIPGLFQYSKTIKAHMEMQKYFQSLIRSVRDKGEYKIKQETFIDAFVHEIDLHKEKHHCHQDKDANNNVYTDEQLICILVDFFITGFVPTGSSVEYLLLFMILHPEIQSRCQAEIDAVVGRNRFPSTSDFENMPYNTAVILELLRHVSPLPLDERKSARDTYVNDSFVSKNTFAVINIYFIHHDPSVWDHPDTFMPERFIGPDGKISKEMLDQLLPFGSGKRVCPAEVFAKTSTFFYSVSLLQRYRFELAPGYPVPDPTPNTNLGNYPNPYYALVTKRNDSC